MDWKLDDIQYVPGGFREIQNHLFSFLVNWNIVQSLQLFFCPPHTIFSFLFTKKGNMICCCSLDVSLDQGQGSLSACLDAVRLYNWPLVQVFLLSQCCWWPFAALSGLLTRSLTECCINLCASQVILKQRSIFQPLTSETSLWHPVKHFVD